MLVALPIFATKLLYIKRFNYLIVNVTISIVRTPGARRSGGWSDFSLNGPIAGYPCPLSISSRAHRGQTVKIPPR